MIRMSLAPLMLVASLGQAAETVKIYNWSDYIASLYASSISETILAVRSESSTRCRKTS